MVIVLKTYELLRNLLAPEKPNSNEYEELVNILRGHFQQEFKFSYNRFQIESEMVLVFIAQIKVLYLL